MTLVTRRNLVTGAALAVPLIANSSLVSAQVSEALLGSASDAERIAMDAYIYGYSLITTEVTRVQMSNVPALSGLHGPMGQFINVKRYPPADYRGVSAPNADTLYSAAWLDLGAEPTVFSHPDMGDRYFLFPMYSLWMPVVECPGARTTGGRAASFLITGPGWSGQVPSGMREIKSPTRYLLILGRTYANGTDADFAAVNALQEQYKLVPLSSFGKPFTFHAPPVDSNPGFSMTDKPQSVILSMPAEDYFNRLARLMGTVAPPAPEDGPMLARMARIGIAPGRPFDAAKLNPAVREALRGLPQRALAVIGAGRSNLGNEVNGWTVTKGLGRYGTDYMKRGVVAAFGWPANLEEDAVYPNTTVDSEGRVLNGANKYTLTFAAGQTPPVNGFWSITMYEVDQGWWFVPNRLNKFTVSLRDDLKRNTDGSITLHFQNESPGPERESNWLPAPKGDFIPMLRMYWPKAGNPSPLDGSWAPPWVQRVS
jgi:hypothetical protein